MIPSESLGFRSFHESDHAFIFATWLRCYRHTSYFSKRIRNPEFFKGHWKIVDAILKKPSTQVLIAHPRDDEETILGYLVCDLENRKLVHFLYVKETFRMMGIARKMMANLELEIEKIFFTHWTYPVDEFMRKWPDMIYDPYGL